MRGQYQHWKPPTYESAIVPILERGPDFTFQDGRKPLVTSKFQLERLVKQADLGKKIVQYLADLKEMEKLHEKEMALNLSNQKIEIEKWTPSSKELKEIF
uniref:Large ribosomal subunit protein mL52 n=1 Tax=Acrobeloides nanus TaxID=290746 RepID=A0A914DVV1_9BILA